MQFSDLRQKLISRNVVLAVYILFAVAATAGQILKSKPTDAFSRYNNYLIFKESFGNLIQDADMYAPRPEKFYDLYKYSPTFAVFFAPFYYMHDYAGLLLWNLVNALPLFLVIWLLPQLDQKKKIFILLFILIELMTNMQNLQSNALVAALMLGAFAAFEKKKLFLASLLVVFSAYIKVFGIAAALLFLFYDGKIKFMLYSIFWFFFFAFLPLIFTDLDILYFQYEGWFELLANDRSISNGISVYGILQSWFGISSGKNAVLICGTVLLLLPLVFFKNFKNYHYRLLFACSIMIWGIIFNHRAESPTYIIAVCGAAIWYFVSPKNKLNTALVIGLFIFTILSPTDLFPRLIRNQFIVPYSLKALPCVLVWIKLNYDLLTQKKFKGLKVSPASAEGLEKI